MAISRQDRETLMTLFGSAAGRKQFLDKPASSGVNLKDANTKELVDLLATMSGKQLAAIADVNSTLFRQGQKESTGPLMARAV